MHRARAVPLGLVLVASCGPGQIEGDTDETSSPAPADGGAISRDTGPPLLPSVTFSPAATTFVDALDVTLVADDPGARIFYTTNDTPPTDASPPYAGPIHVTASTVVRAVAINQASARGPAVARAYLKLAPDAADFTSSLPIVVLHSTKARPTVKATTYTPGSFTLFQPDAKTGKATLRDPPQLSARMGIHVRGSSSSGFAKKNYKVELWAPEADDDADYPVLGMPADSDWTLYSGDTFDRTLVRNAFMYALSNQIGRWAPHTRFVEVYFTDMSRPVAAADYIGVYSIVETIKQGKHRVAVQKLRPEDVTAPIVTGGYIFKVDRLNAGDKGLAAGYGPMSVWTKVCDPGIGGICNLYTPLAYHYPKEPVLVAAQKTYLTGAVNAFADPLAMGGDWRPSIDVPSWIDHHILNVLPKNPDGLRLSGYFFKDREGRIFAGPIWDFDRTLGCTNDGRCNDPTWWDAGNVTMDTTNMFNYAWWRGLFKDAAFKQAYFDRFRALMAKDFKADALTALVDMLAAQIGPEAAARNFVKWKSDAPAGGYAAEVQRMKDWTVKRVQWINGCLAMPDPLACRGN